MGAGFGCVVSKVTIWGKGARPGKWEHTVNGGTVNGGTTVYTLYFIHSCLVEYEARGRRGALHYTLY